MPTTGRKFLRLNKISPEELEIAKHALWKIKRGTDLELTEEEALKLFLNGRLLDIDEVYKLGYRPRYHGRKKRGNDTWYFLLDSDIEMLAVIGRQRKMHKKQKINENMTWVTTYIRTKQTDLYRVKDVSIHSRARDATGYS